MALAQFLTIVLVVYFAFTALFSCCVVQRIQRSPGYDQLDTDHGTNVSLKVFLQLPVVWGLTGASCILI